MESTSQTNGTTATGSIGPSTRVTEHPLQKAEMTFHEREDLLEMALLRRSQGIHLPLRLQAERKCLSKVGHFHFFHRNEASLNALTGRDELLGFDDFLGHAADSEVMRQPHAVLEKNRALF